MEIEKEVLKTDVINDNGRKYTEETAASLIQDWIDKTEGDMFVDKAINKLKQTIPEFGVKLVTSHSQIEHDDGPENYEYTEEEKTIINIHTMMPIPKICKHCKEEHKYPAGMIFSNPDDPNMGTDEGYKNSIYYCFKCMLSMFSIISKMLAVKEEKDRQTYRGQFAFPGTGE